METENIESVVEEITVDAPEEIVVETAPEASVEVEVKPTGRDAVEAAFDKVASKTAKTEEPTAEEPTADKTEKEEPTEDKTVVTKGLDPAGRGPNSWKASVREKFQSLPPDVRTEVLRRENEHQKLMTETTALRKFGEEFTNAYRPYEAFLNSTGVHPITAFKDLMNTVYTLKTADQATKGQMIASIIKTHGVDLTAIDNALAGQIEQVDPKTAAIQQELNQLKQWRAQEEQQRQMQTTYTVEQQIQSFASDPKNEFFQDVVGDMQILLGNGRASTLEEAYEMACRMNPEVYSVLKTRTTQPASRPAMSVAPQVTPQQKVAASSGVKGAPVSNRPASVKPVLSGRDAAMAAWDKLERKTRT
jgi:hypothetical protein